ncbi:DgyrCDS4548 [Dimorphilus gyrociliatus]|uniref:DgyrCDS4548 n=1 Tax=Dimorphilus gyrociliatus TaxID=2664684 RepID=A0A7I8VGV9_9ANNE|nr:DgyrCDS4548 [Dimorphilus gyrociliatus]
MIDGLTATELDNTLAESSRLSTNGRKRDYKFMIYCQILNVILSIISIVLSASKIAEIQDDPILNLFIRIKTPLLDADFLSTTLIEVSYYLIISGSAATLLTSPIGLYAGVAQLKALKEIYIVLANFIFIAQSTAIVFAATHQNQILKDLDKHMSDVAAMSYRGIDYREKIVIKNDPYSLGWDSAMIKFKCCGIVNDKDNQGFEIFSRVFHYVKSDGSSLSTV